VFKKRAQSFTHPALDFCEKKEGDQLKVKLDDFAFIGTLEFKAELFVDGEQAGMLCCCATNSKEEGLGEHSNDFPWVSSWRAE